MPDRRPLLLDVDTGVDDAIAISLASRLETHELVAVTTVAGNVPIERATDNTLKVLGWLDRSVPVFRGMSAPLVRPLHSAEEFHGSDGLGGWIEPVAVGNVESASAPEKIIQIARRYKGEIDFAFVGPLTNLAVALKLEPRVAEWVNRLVIMGGAFFGPGNVTEHAEFNIYVDPEAAITVARSGINATWIGLDVTMQTVLSKNSWSNMASSNGRSAALTYQVCRHAFLVRQRPEFHLHDPLAVAVIADPSFVNTSAGEVLVSIDHEHRALTRLSPRTGTDSGQLVAAEVNARRFEEWFGLHL